MKILIPFDGSDNALRALAHVLARRAALREPEKVEMHVLNVQPPVSGRGSMFLSGEELERYHKEEAQKVLAGAQAVLDKAGVPMIPHIIVGDPGSVIAKFAKDRGIDEIAVGARGHGTVASLMVGSVTQKLLYLSTVPLLVVR